MQKYKICPSCGAKNDPVLMECLTCEADLTRVKITDEENEKNAEESRAIEKVSMVRICDCGEQNPANARKCKACGEDISDVTPEPSAESVHSDENKTEQKEERKAPAYVLSTPDGKYAYNMAEGEVIVGRENVMNEYLIAKSYVSRIHAKLSLQNGVLFVENLSNTNYTYVNNRKILEKTVLEDGDELGLGGINIGGKYQREAAYFIVRICPCI